MEKLINFRCIGCDNEKEIYLSSDIVEKIVEDGKEKHTMECPLCGADMVMFNYARHSRWRFMD